MKPNSLIKNGQGNDKVNGEKKNKYNDEHTRKYTHKHNHIFTQSLAQVICIEYE